MIDIKPVPDDVKTFIYYAISKRDDGQRAES